MTLVQKRLGVYPGSSVGLLWLASWNLYDCDLKPVSTRIAEWCVCCLALHKSTIEAQQTGGVEHWGKTVEYPRVILSSRSGRSRRRIRKPTNSKPLRRRAGD